MVAAFHSRGPAKPVDDFMERRKLLICPVRQNKYSPDVHCDGNELRRDLARDHQLHRANAARTAIEEHLKDCKRCTAALCGVGNVARLEAEAATFDLCAG
jgi:hypothetical protein